MNMDFEENSPFQEGVISEMYQRPDNSYFQEHQELHSLINAGKLIHKFLPKQTDIDKILKIMQRKVLKRMHLPVMVKEIQDGYLISSYFKDLYCYLAKKNDYYKDCNLNSRNTSRKIYTIRFPIV